MKFLYFVMIACICTGYYIYGSEKPISSNVITLRPLSIEHNLITNNTIDNESLTTHYNPSISSTCLSYIVKSAKYFTPFGLESILHNNKFFIKNLNNAHPLNKEDHNKIAYKKELGKNTLFLSYNGDKALHVAKAGANPIVCINSQKWNKLTNDKKMLSIANAKIQITHNRPFKKNCAEFAIGLAIGVHMCSTLNLCQEYNKNTQKFSEFYKKWNKKAKRNPFISGSVASLGVGILFGPFLKSMIKRGSSGILQAETTNQLLNHVDINGT